MVEVVTLAKLYMLLALTEHSKGTPAFATLDVQVVCTVMALALILVQKNIGNVPVKDTKHRGCSPKSLLSSVLLAQAQPTYLSSEKFPAPENPVNS